MKTHEPITVVGALASGRTCLGCDKDGEWHFMLTLPSDEGRKLAARIDELRDTAIAVVMQPIKG